MLTIQSVLNAAKTVKSTDSVADANRKLLNVAFEYCKQHQLSNELILIVSINGMKPFLYSHSFDFSVPDLHNRVNTKLSIARRNYDAPVIVLEWLTLKEQTNPYYVLNA
jgi:hypothetical protein